MEERREMNGQRMMTREELEMRLPALNHIAEQKDAKFRLRYAEKTVNNGIERGYTLDAGTRVSVNVYQNESWAQMPDEELFDTLNDLDGRYCVTEDQETIGERLNALFKSGELFEKIYPVVVSENNKENFAEAGITFDRYLDMLVTYRVELMQMNDGIGTIRLQDSHLETFGISRQKIREAAFANLEGIVDFMTLRDDASGFKMVAAARKDKQFGGAASMLLPSVRRRLAKMFGTDSLVFLPSSISEVIVVAQTAGEPETLLAMVHEINEMEVALEERLTDSIYPVLSPAWKADGYDELGIIYDRYLDLLVTYVVEGESETDGYAAAIVTYDNLDTFDLPRGKLFEYASRNLKSDIRIGFTGTTGQLAMLEIGRLSGGVGGASALLLSSVWESAAKLFGTEKIIFFALSNCELMAVVAEERIIHALKSGLFDAARESVPVEESFPKSIYGLVPDKSGYSLHRF